MPEQTIYSALAAVMSDVRHVAKRDFNDHQRFSFRGVDAVVNAVGPALRDHGVIVVPAVLSVEYAAVTTTNNKPSTACRVLVEYRFYGPAGDSLAATVAGEAWDHGDKATPKAMSVAFRTALLQALSLPTDEPDPDSHTYEQGRPADPLHAAKVEVAEAWKTAHGGTFDADVMREHYEQWAAAPLSEADPKQLHDYASHLLERDAAKADRSKGPAEEDDTWQTASQKQITALSAALTKAGLKDRAEVMDFIETAIGRRVESRTELTGAEAGKALEAVRHLKKQEAKA